LFKHGIQQYQTNQFTAALQSWEQALKIYQEIQDRRGEGKVQGNLGAVFLDLGDYPKAIEKLQHSLAIARETEYRQGEVNALGNLGVCLCQKRPKSSIC
jgi:tetratricopeptide (TPR) repeat protein